LSEHAHRPGCAARLAADCTHRFDAVIDASPAAAVEIGLDSVVYEDGRIRVSACFNCYAEAGRRAVVVGRIVKFPEVAQA